MITITDTHAPERIIQVEATPLEAYVNAVARGEDQVTRAREAADDASDSATEAALYDGPKVDIFAELSNITPAMLAVGEYIRCIELNEVYKRVESGGFPDYSGSGGVQFEVQPSKGVVTFTAFGAVADTTETVDGTDNAAALLAALNTGFPVVVPRPPEGYAFGVSQVSLPRRAVIFGPGENTLAIRGLTTSATLTGGTVSGDLKREYTISDLYVENNRGGDAVDMDWAPDWNFTRVYFRSVGNATLGTSAARGLNMKNCERGHLGGQCRFGGNPALRLVKDCNGVRGDNVVVSGGSAGLALDISGCQSVKMPVTIETSLEGVRLGDNTGDNATNGGWTSGIDLSGSYFESVGTPIVAGEGFAVNGLALNDCWLNNAALADNSPFPVSSAVLRMGRVKSLQLKGGRWVGAGTEYSLLCVDAVATSGAAPAALESADVDLTVFESTIGLRHTTVTALGNRADVAAKNRVYTDDERTKGLGIPFEWISPQLAANTTYGTMTLTKALGAGGRVTSMELIEGDGGSLNGARIRAGTLAAWDVVDVTFGAVNHTYFDFGVTAGLLRGGSAVAFRLDAGTGAGKFRIRIRGVVGYD